LGYVTTPELAATTAVRALVRELRALRPGPKESEKCRSQGCDVVRCLRY
jgi:hypothetical protein